MKDLVTFTVENAIKIAELLGIKRHILDFGESRIPARFYYSSYNGLMPIVFECNSSHGNYHWEIEIKVNNIKLLELCDSQETIYIVDTYTYQTQPEFILALQECIIKYLEVKND